MPDLDSLRRRDVLRAGAAGGLAAFGWSVGGVSAQDQTTEQRQQTAYAFSYSLQSGDRFRVWSRIRTPEGDPATERIPAECLEDGPREFGAFVVRADRNGIQLGYEGVFFPPDTVETGTTETTTATNETTTSSPGNGTATIEKAATTETATGGALPAIRVGGWYRVTAMSKCNGLARLSLEPAEPPTDSDGA
ncbi:hypothetical protein [Halorussus lipolyticus]|uniref:hypothetical protein n=1 Tax=Halorussus lipolyticus TaxID=3034024 RepID=UPI0023E7D0E4|nr:hypothetical protein [Halorussus sp. DT80]